MTTRTGGIIAQNKVFLWLAAAIGLILLAPLLAMRFTDQVIWSLFDFAAAGALLFGFGAVFVLTMRRLRRYRVIVAVTLTVALAYLWLELAVGVFTMWGS